MTFLESPDLLKLSAFNSLSLEVTSCQKCPRMCNSARILGLSSGSLDAKLMFIGEAPGRLGADETGIPFHGDKAGDNFEALLEFVNISRDEVFITNSVLCNPKDEQGNNSSPTISEIQNCVGFLKRQIDLVNPLIVITLGANALKATSLLEHHSLTLKNDVRTQVDWYGRKLIPLYHPGQRAMLHRSFANQRSDYQFVADSYHQIGRPKKVINGYVSDTVAMYVKAILKAKAEVSYFALHKLMYLLEWDHVKRSGKRLTGAYFIRQKDGPYCTDLHLTKIKNSIEGLRIRKLNGKIFLSLDEGDLFSTKHIDENHFPIAMKNKLENIISKSDAELKTSAYMTKPMRDILLLERSLSVNLYNAPIKFH